MCSENILFYYLKAVKLVLLSDRPGRADPRSGQGRAESDVLALDPIGQVASVRSRSQAPGGCGMIALRSVYVSTESTNWVT